MMESLGQWGPNAETVGGDAACFGRVGAGSFRPRTGVNGAVFTAAARLDNRDELADLLGVGGAERQSLSNECLVVRAFEQWGEACPTRLNGDWSLAVWSPATKRLFLARDHFGSACLYYAHYGGRIAFASDIKALLSLRWLPRRLDESRVASLLVAGGAQAPDSTIYRDVARLPPAHFVTITPGHARVVRYWRVEDTPDSGPSSSPERVEELRTTLRAAVRSRLGGRDHVGSMLSGGLDSGAVTAFAAEHLHSQGHRLTAFTSVPAFTTSSSGRSAALTDEGPGAADVVRSFDSIDHVLVPARAVSPVAGIRRALAIRGEPPIPAANMGWITELMADAQARGIGILLSGQVGDFVMAGRPAVPSWRRDWSAGRYRRLAKRVVPPWLLRLRGAEWKPRRAGTPWRTTSVVSRGFAADTGIAEYLRDVDSDPWRAVRRMATRDAGALWAPLGAAFGLTVLDPLQDKRVMEFMFSGPRPEHAGTADRWLFRQSLAGVLPDEVRLSRSKGIQSADIVERLVATWTEVEDALALAEASPLARRCIDLRYCRALAASLRTPQPPQQARRKAFLLLDGLSMALFLAEAS